jgi:hypothetical protein
VPLGKPFWWLLWSAEGRGEASQAWFRADIENNNVLNSQNGAAEGMKIIPYGKSRIDIAYTAQ